MGWDGMDEAGLADERGGMGWEEMGLAKLLTNGVAWYGVGVIGREGLERDGVGRVGIQRCLIAVLWRHVGEEEGHVEFRRCSVWHVPQQ